MHASLSMYDRPETRAANDRYWDLIAEALADLGQDAPQKLDRESDPWDVWQSPNLVLSQTCGLPFRAKLHEHVSLAATPVWEINAPAGHYFSVLVTKHGFDTAIADATIAVNEPLSQSGWAAPSDWAIRQGTQFKSTLLTGAHIASAKAVAEGKADIAAIDAVTWTMIKRWDSFAKNLKEFAQTRPTPTLPYITSKQNNPDTIYKAVCSAIATLSKSDAELLCLKSAIQLNKADYLAEPLPPNLY